MSFICLPSSCWYISPPFGGGGVHTTCHIEPVKSGGIVSTKAPENRASSFNSQNPIPNQPHLWKVPPEISSVKDRKTVFYTLTVRDRKAQKRLFEALDHRLGAGCRVFESPHSDQWHAATVTPYPAPSKEGAFPLYRILVTAWSLNIQSVLHRCGVPPRSRPTRPSALPVEGRWSVPGDKTSKMPRDNRACRHSHALPGPLERGGHTLCTEF